MTVMIEREPKPSPKGVSASETRVQVYSLPGLELLLCQELQDGLTFPWAWTSEQAQLIRASAVAPDGQLAMVRTVHASKGTLYFALPASEKDVQADM